MSLRLRETIRPLLLAPLGAVLVFGVVAVVSDPSSFGVIVYVYPFSLAAGLVFVVPLLAVMPGLRRPPFWLAAAWGVPAAWAFTAILVPPHLFSFSAVGGLAGAASGLVYALAARH